MTQKLNPFSGRQFLDANGDPYVGAQLFTYVAGSSTKSTTTKDSAGVSSHANPIILNSRGEPGDGAGSSQAIWQTEGVSVKLVLAPSTDTDPPVSPISTWDNLTGIGDAALADQDQWTTGPAPTYISATSFTLVGDQSTDFHVGRRLKSSNTSGTIYSTITSVAYTTLTTVTVENDSGALDSGLSSVSYGILTATGTAIPGGIHYPDTTLNGVRTYNKTVKLKKGADIASANDLALLSDGNYNDITGTTTINGLTDGIAGEIRKIHFDGGVLIKHDTAPSAGYSKIWVTNGAIDYTTIANDELEFIYDGTYWRISNIFRAHRVGELVHLETQTALIGSTTTLTFTTQLDSTYDEYVILFDGLYAAVNATLGVQVSLDSGSTFKTDATYHYVITGRNATAATAVTGGATNATSSLIIGDVVANSNFTGSGRLTFVKPYIAGYRSWRGEIDYFNTANNSSTFINFSGAYRGAVGPVHRLRFICTQLFAANFKLYGRIK